MKSKCIDARKLVALIEEQKYTIMTMVVHRRSFNALQEAIQVAKSALDSIETEEDLKDSICSLQSAIDGLEEVDQPDPEVDTTELETLIENRRLHK